MLANIDAAMFPAVFEFFVLMRFEFGCGMILNLQAKSLMLLRSISRQKRTPASHSDCWGFSSIPTFADGGHLKRDWSPFDEFLRAFWIGADSLRQVKSL